MINTKRLKSILLTTSLTLGLSLIQVNAYAGTYTTVGGDSLYKISQIYNTTISNLINDNNLSSTTLNIGQKLYVSCNTYTVQKGDNLFLIARKYRMPLSTLRRANNIYSDMIFVGQKLNIPVLPGVASATVTPSTRYTSAGTYNDEKIRTENPADYQQLLTLKQAYTDAFNRGDTVGMEKAHADAEAIRAKYNYSGGGDGSDILAPTNYSASDLDLLARLITAEAQGQPYEAQVAVGAVVMNRVKSGLFPNSISGVIYQNINGYYQFTPVVNGYINKPALPDSINAAKDALNGADPSKGALFYYDDSTTSKWILSKPVKAVIGNMVYAE